MSKPSCAEEAHTSAEPSAVALPADVSDAVLIYNALLRAERRLEKLAAKRDMSGALAAQANFIIGAIREEIGNGLSKGGRG